MTEREIFFEAIEITSADARAAYLQGACGKDVTLRRKVEELLQEHFANDSLLSKPALDGPPTLLDPTPVTEGPGAQIGRYKLLQKLGEGGFGVVYMAEQKEPVKRRVALKIIKLGMDTQQVVARFEAERQALAMMDHPNIAKVLDAGATDTGRPYFVMELVKGVPITRYCDDNNLTTQERLELFIAVCQAIQHAHQKGIIHRDIKPSNVMVTLHDGVPVPKVIDFGIAKATQQELTEKTIFTQFSQFIGTPAYMSPEQAEMSGLDIDTRSDIYSLGVLLYELLVGKTPLDGKELMSGGYDEIRRRIKEEEPAKPSTRVNTMEGSEKTTVARHRKVGPDQLSSELRGDLDWIVLKALEKDRTRRYETANGFALDIKRFLKNEPVAAVAPSSGYLLKKYAQRHRGAMAAAAAIVGLLVVGITVSTWQAVRATRAQKAAEKAQSGELEQRVLAQGKQKEAEQERQRAEVQQKRAEEGELQTQHLLYAVNMNVAQQAWEQNNANGVRRLLEDTAQFADRGFEWYYWQRQTHLELKTLRGHTGPILTTAYSPDGRRIVTGSADNTARVWDAATGKELFSLNGHSAMVRSAAFSSNGQQIVTGSSDGKVKVWSATTGANLLTFRGRGGRIFSVAFSPDHRWIVTGSEDHTARVWAATTGDLIRTLKGHAGRVLCVAFSPDGRRIVTGSWDKAAKVWNAADGHEISTLNGHKGAVYSVAFSPDGEKIISGSWDHSAKVWAAADGHELFTISGHSGAVVSATFSPDGQQIATAGDDQTARVWDANREHELLTIKRHASPISSVAFSPDGQGMITAGGNPGMAPDGNEFPQGDSTIKVWQTSNDRELLTLKGHRGDVMAVAISRDGRRVVTGSQDGTAKVWDLDSGRELLQLEGHTNAVAGVAMSPDGQWIATGSWDKTVKIWEAISGKLIRTFEQHSIAFMSVSFSPDSQHIIACGKDNRAKVWDVASGAEKLTITGEPGWIWSAVYSPDGQRILTANEGYDNLAKGKGDTAKVWDAVTGKELLALKGHTSWVMSAAFSSDGSRIVTSSHDHVAKVWDAATGTNLVTLKGHSSFVIWANFSPNGQRIVTGSQDGTARVWDAVSGKELLNFKGHGGWVFEAAFSPDGRRIVTGSGDKIARVWEAASPDQVASWRQDEQAAAEHRAALDRERAEAQKQARELRAQDPGITQWLVLAPISFAGPTGEAALDQEQLPQEARLRPRVGEAVTIGQAQRLWTAVPPKDHWLDFNQLVGKETEFSVAYAVCYLVSDTEKRGLVMKVGSDDQAKILLNGREIYRQTEPRSWEPDRDQVPSVELKAGLNVLVFKVVNEKAGWGGSVRFTDTAGQPVQGIRVTLDPDAAK